jgi:NADH-quinone oxidoreductase subunit G
MCIDICPVGALTSGAYRYKTRPWEMNHVGTICTHCGDGCKTTLGVRRSDTGMEIVRGDNRDKSGINGDFLCVKGRYAFDFAHHAERLTQPLVRKNGKLTPATWEEAFELIGNAFREVRDGAMKRRERDRRDRLESHHQRRKLSAVEICPRRAQDQ